MFNKKWGTRRIMAIIMSVIVLEPVVLSTTSTVSYAEEMSGSVDSSITGASDSSSQDSSSNDDSESDQNTNQDSSGTGAGNEEDDDSASDNSSTASTIESSNADDSTTSGSNDDENNSSSNASAATASTGDSSDVSSSASTGDSSDAASSASTGDSSDAASSASTEASTSKTKGAVLGATRTVSPMEDQGDDGYENFTSDTQVADFVFGTDGNLTSESAYDSENGYGFSDVDYNTDPTGWSGGVYYERQANITSGSSNYVSDSEDYLEIKSKVWTETESTGYGVYTYENTSTLDVDLYNADYKVEVTLVNPTSSSYTASLEAEDISQVTDITLSAGAESTSTYEVSLIDGTLNLKFLAASSATSIDAAATSSVYVKEVVITRLSTDSASSKPIIYVASDSTVQTYDSYYYPQTGWGQTFYNWFGDLVEERESDNASFSQAQVYESENATIDNRSIGGRSSKSYVEEGKLEDVLEDINQGDYLFIQWGHNDATASRPNRYVSTSDFSKWIMMYVNGAYQRGATPVLVTPVSRYSYTYDSDGNLTWKSDFESYRQVMIEIANEYDIPIIDLTSRSGDICESFGAEGAKALFLTGVEAGDYTEGAYTGGSSDCTHLQWYGAYKFSQAVAQGIVDYANNTDNDYKLVDTCNEQLDALASLVEIATATDAPSKVTGLEVTSKGSTSVSLAWESAEGAELYYIYRAELSDGVSADDIDFSSLEKYSVSSKCTYTDSSCEAGTTYVYAVAAYNSYGLGDISESIEATTKTAGYKFDFNYNSSPTMDGWTGVTQSQAYSEEAGYGWISAPGNGRYRSGNGKEDSSDMADDFCLGTGEFAVDLPNGSYEVTIYAGDLLPGTSTIKCAYTAEGVSIGSIACKQSIGSCTATVSVTDGQLNIVVGGTNNYINGMTITSLLTAPGNLTITELSFSDTTASFLFAFNTVEEAVSYSVYQKTSSDSDYSVVKTYTADELVTNDLDCRAMVADLGETYSYYMTCTTADGVESPSSNVVTKEMLDSSVQVPSAVENVECTSPKEDATELQNSITLSWDANTTSEKVIKYVIYRSEKAESDKAFKEFTKIGTSTTTTFTDSKDVATNIHYYYKVAAMNAGGIGEMSDVCITPIVGNLVAGGLETYSSRQVVAISLSGSAGAQTHVSATDSEGNAVTSGVYLSWRAYKEDFSSNNLTTTFNVYRNDVRIATNISSTNCIDEGGSSSDVYRVVGSNDSSLGLKCIGTVVWDDQYIELQLSKPDDQTMPDGSTCTYTANDMSVGDLDGDGDHELVVKWYPSNAKDNSGSGYTGTTFLDAYNVDFASGSCELMWRIDMGINIRSGAHYTQFQVWDYDADGAAEIAVKTADGTTTYDSDLNETGYVGACSMADLNTSAVSDENDYRNSSGYILDGPEYFTMFNGEDGTIIDTVEYTPSRGTVSAWGDGYGNRVDRFLSCTAYLNGTTPFAVFCRGYYTRTCLTAYYLSTADDGTQSIGTYWTFDTNDAGSQYESQGNHSVIVADVDGDDKDEIIYGSLTLDNDGSVLYSTGLGHGDAEHVSDFIESNDGLEVMDVHEHDDATYHVEIHDAETGEILSGYYTGKDTGRGMASDIDPTSKGAEYWSIADPSYSSNDEPSWNSRNASVYSGESGVYNSSDEDGSNLIVLTEGSTPAVNFCLYWDGDLLAEMQDHTFDSSAYAPLTTTIEKWDYENGTSYTLFESSEVLTSNGTKGNLGLVGDILGDWRDEIIARCADDPSKIRIYSTTITTDYVIPCSLTDLQYREAIAWQNVGYNQPAHTSYLISNGLITSSLSEGDVTADSIEVLFTEACDGATYGHDVEGYSVYRADVTTDSEGKELVGDYEKLEEIDIDDLQKGSADGSSSKDSDSSESDPVYLKFDFGSGDVEDGYTQVLADTAYSTSSGYGFSQDTLDTVALSNKTYKTWNDEDNAALLNDSVFGWIQNGSAEFDVDLPDGTYEVTYIVANGSGAYYQEVSLEGTVVSTTSNFRHGRTDTTTDQITATVTVSDGTLNIVSTVSKKDYCALYFTGIEIKDVTYDEWLLEKEASESESEADEDTNEDLYSFVDDTVEAGSSYSYKIAAVVDGKDSYNSRALTITSGIEVAGVVDSDISFDIPNSLEFEDDEALEDYIISLKSSYAVKDSDGNESSLQVKSIDVSGIDMSTIGSYEAYVALKGYSETVKITVNVVENVATGFAEIEDITVVVGTSVTLPETVEATFLDNTTSTAQVTWDTSELDINTVGIYTLKGTVEGAEDGTYVTVTVNVVEDYVVSASDVYVEAVCGGNVEDYLPETVSATYYSGEDKAVEATYDTSSVDMNTCATYSIPASIEGSDITFTLYLVVRYEALYSFDFGISASNSADGWTTLTANAKGGTKTFDELGLTYSEEKGYGFTDGTATSQGRKESYEYTQGVIPQNVYTDFIIPDGQTFVVDVENGNYEVDIISGSYYKSTVKATIEGTSVSVSNTAATYTIGTYTVSIADGQLTIVFTEGATSRLDGIVVRKVGSTYNSSGEGTGDDTEEDNPEVGTGTDESSESTDNEESSDQDDQEETTGSTSGSEETDSSTSTDETTTSGSSTSSGSTTTSGSTSSDTTSDTSGSSSDTTTSSGTTTSGTTSSDTTTSSGKTSADTTATNADGTTSSGDTTSSDDVLVADAGDEQGEVAGATRKEPTGSSSSSDNTDADTQTGSEAEGTQKIVSEVENTDDENSDNKEDSETVNNTETDTNTDTEEGSGTGTTEDSTIEDDDTPKAASPVQRGVTVAVVIAVIAGFVTAGIKKGFWIKIFKIIGFFK